MRTSYYLEWHLGNIGRDKRPRTMGVIHSFISGISIVPLQVRYYSEALPTEHGCCVGVSLRTANKGLAQGPYLADRAGFEPTTLRTKGDESTNEPPHAKLTQNDMTSIC